MPPLGFPEIIEAPQPPDEPVPTALFTVAPPSDPTGSRWAVGGVTWDPPGGCGTATRWAECSGAVKPVDGPGTIPVFQPFAVVAGYRCSTLGAAEDPGRYARQAEEALDRHVSNQAEAELWGGSLALANAWDAPFLADGNATLINSGTATAYTSAFAQLLREMRACMGNRRGVLHMAADVAAILERVRLLRVNAATGAVESLFGDVVVAGGGYPGGGAVANTVYTVTTTGSSNGTFTLTVTNPSSGSTETTASIAYDANAAAVASALAALSFIAPTDLVVAGGPLPTATTVTFTGDLAGVDVTVTGTGSLTGGALAVTKTTTGGSQPDSDLSSTWIYGTGALITRAGPVAVTPSETRDVDLRTNTVTVFAERMVLAGFDTCCQIAVQADLTDSGGAGGDVDGGSP